MEVKHIGPNPEILKIINIILTINAAVLDMNSKLIKELTLPVRIIPSDLLKEAE